MFKIVLILGILSLSMITADPNLYNYCRSSDKEGCTPAEYSRLDNNRWFICRWSKSKHACIPAFEEIGQPRSESKTRVTFDNDVKCTVEYDDDLDGLYVADKSFDAIPRNKPFPIGNIRSFCNFEGVAKIKVDYSDSSSRTYYEGDWDLNVVPDNATPTRVVIHPQPKRGCALLFTEADFFGDFWEICEGNFSINPARAITFKSIIMGEGAEIQFWGINDKGMTQCEYIPDSGYYCMTYRHSQDPLFDGVNGEWKPRFISLCSNKVKHNRCYNHSGDGENFIYDP